MMLPAAPINGQEANGHFSQPAQTMPALPMEPQGSISAQEQMMQLQLQMGQMNLNGHGHQTMQQTLLPTDNSNQSVAFPGFVNGQQQQAPTVVQTDPGQMQNYNGHIASAPNLGGMPPQQELPPQQVLPPGSAPSGLPPPQANGMAPHASPSMGMGTASKPGCIQAQRTRARVGIRNWKNTCYMNSLLQCLFLTDAFSAGLFDFELQPPKKSRGPMDDDVNDRALFEGIKDLFAKLFLTSRPHVDLTQFITEMPDRFRSGEQQDFTDSARFILEHLGGYDQPLVRNVFAGELEHVTCCQFCGHRSSRPTTFSDLEFMVPAVSDPSQGPTLQQLYNNFLEVETLDGDNKWECPQCQCKRDAKKWTAVLSPPGHLFVVLNRFTSFDEEKLVPLKTKTYVRLQEPLHIQNACGVFVYHLYAVVVHQGDHGGEGHYYCFGCRSEADQRQWSICDDSQVREVPEQDLYNLSQGPMINDNPYVLFYRCVQLPKSHPPQLPSRYIQEVEQWDRIDRGG
mmetsp:Transcript_45647/g.97461  ORF Transcript_45647/g.97461 Transcript_45647/m.97461 type:complete len:511 (-) Transcript_45647:47-1579(-)